MSTNIGEQETIAFFSPDGTDCNLPGPPSDKEVLQFLRGPNCPLNRVVVSDRNRPAMDGLFTLAFHALMRHDHSCRGLNFGFYCGPGQGKTFTIKCFAETIGIPFIPVQSDALESTWQLFEMIAEAFKRIDVKLVPISNEYHYCIPPCLVFFDEAQALSKDLRTGGLLNAMESNDGWLQTNPPKGRTHTIDCQHVCWIAASTDPGEIYSQSEAFHSRLAQHVVWHPAGPNEVPLIVQREFPELPIEACKLVAHYVLVPRKAIAFARLMIMKQRMLACSWKEAAHHAAVINGIDEFGMELKQVDILRALGNSPVARTNLPTIARCRPTELEKILLPPLFDHVDGRGQLVRPTHKGYAITKDGIRELERRKIPHKGDKITAEAIEGV